MKFKSLMRFICVAIAAAIMCTSTVSASADSNEQITTSVEAQSASNTVYGPGRWYMGKFAFNSENYGYYHTYKGSRMRMCIAYRQEDNDYYSADMLVSFYGYSDGLKYQRILCAGQDEPDEDGYRYYVLDWIPILSGGDYRFEYIAYTCGDTYLRRTVSCHVWIDVE